MRSRPGALCLLLALVAVLTSAQISNRHAARDAAWQAGVFAWCEARTDEPDREARYRRSREFVDAALRVAIGASLITRAEIDALAAEVARSPRLDGRPLTLKVCDELALQLDAPTAPPVERDAPRSDPPERTDPP